MFNRLGQTFGDSALVEAARRYYLDAAAGPASGPALATGAAGIALALIGASSATPPTWDRALLTAM